MWAITQVSSVTAHRVLRARRYGRNSSPHPVFLLAPLSRDT